MKHTRKDYSTGRFYCPEVNTKGNFKLSASVDADTIERMLQMVAITGKSLASIARETIEKGLPIIEKRYVRE